MSTAHETRSSADLAAPFVEMQATTDNMLLKPTHSIPPAQLVGAGHRPKVLPHPETAHGLVLPDTGEATSAGRSARSR
jgi:hypothetical protein